MRKVRFRVFVVVRLIVRSSGGRLLNMLLCLKFMLILLMGVLVLLWMGIFVCVDLFSVLVC